MNFTKYFQFLIRLKSYKSSCNFTRNFSLFDPGSNYVCNVMRLDKVGFAERLSVLKTQNRFKYTREKKSKDKDEDSDSDSDDDVSNEPLEKNAKLITAYLSTPRLDAVIKAGLGIARNKADLLYYENKVRINGYKVPKKSHRVHLDDEVDVIKSVLHEGSRLVVARVVLKSAKEVDDRDELKCQLKVFKKLEIDNYSDHPFKSQPKEES